MKNIIFFLLCLIVATTTNAQTLGERINQKVKDRVNSKVDQTIDKGLDATEKAADDAAKKKDKNAKPGTQTTNKDSLTTASVNQQQQTTVQKASDFLPGNKIIFEDNFSKDALGDFPAKWNTNGSGDVTTIEGLEGRWLNIVHNSIVTPEMGKAMPENCTIEFDLFLQANNNMMIPNIQFGITSVKNILKEDIYYNEKFYMSISRYNEKDGQAVEYGLRDLIGNKNNFPLTSYVNKILHVSMAINNTRIRVYFDTTKLIDLPRALTPAMRNNFFINNVYTVPASELGVLVSNVRIAETVTDARSGLSKQLMEEGRVSTSDILFDVNKDVIKSASFPIIDDIGEAMQNNATLNIKIVGYTDADGEADANQVLSEKRAVAVKKYIQDKFKISAGRMITEGMGELQPVAVNTTEEGKAKNRRVEFIKL